MNAEHLVAALALPPDVRVDQRVPKKLLLEEGAPTATDRRSSRLSPAVRCALPCDSQGTAAIEAAPRWRQGSPVQHTQEPR